MTTDGAGSATRGKARGGGAGAPRPAARWAWIPGVVGFLALVTAFAAAGGPHDAGAGLATVAFLVARAGAPAAAYLAGAWGLGRLAQPLFRGASQPLTLQLAVGLAIMLSLSHGMGCLGLLAGGSGRIVGTGVCAAGLLLLAHQFLGMSRNGSLSGIAVPPTALLAAPGLAILLVAACSPPGWLWESEFGGYDALSYHLQLPQEWIAAGRIWPATHNVYSYLPSYVESAFVHLGAITGAPARAPEGVGAMGLLTGEGLGVISAQLMHAGLAVCAAALAARAALLAAQRAELHESDSVAGAGLSFALFMLTPWTVVVGSLAYNEMGMAALFAGAMIAAMEREIPAARRGAVVGLLVGVACGCKPTALLFAGAPAAVLMLGMAPRREWPALIAGGAAAGLAALAPWLIRNWTACGNPVFPYATGLFGAAHWSAEQVARYKAAHAFDGTLTDRFRLLVAVDPSDPAGARHRGMFHPQWSIAFPLVAASAATAMWHKPARRVAVLITAGLACGIVAWLFATHLQSRFLLPLLTPGVVLFGTAGAIVLGLTRRAGTRASPVRARATLLAISVLTLLPGAWAAAIFLGQHGGRPNAELVPGPGEFSGEAFRSSFRSADPAARRQFLENAPPVVFANLALPASSKLMLVGDATPLYFTVPVRYTTTWDRSPLGDAMAAAPNEPASWTSSLRRAGIDTVLVNFSELGRQERSKMLDPATPPDRVAEWVRSQGVVIREWRETGQVLLALPRPAGESP